MDLSRLHRSEVRVRRARIRAPTDQSRAVRAELERASWPEAPGESWILIRALRVEGRRGSVRGSGQGSLVARAQTGIEALIREAVEVGTPSAASANAVRCADLPNLLAALCADLAAGRAASLWYWRAWSDLFGLPPGPAVATLLAGYPDRLTTLTDRLARRGVLAPVWRVMGPDDIARVSASLGAWLGHPLPDARNFGAAPGQEMRDPGAPPPALQRRWAAALVGMGTDDPAPWLAACLCALEWRPRWLADGRVAAIRTIAEALLARPHLAEPVPMVGSDPAPMSTVLDAPDRHEGFTMTRIDGTASAHTQGSQGSPGYEWRSAPGLRLDSAPDHPGGRWPGLQERPTHAEGSPGEPTDETAGPRSAPSGHGDESVRDGLARDSNARPPRWPEPETPATQPVGSGEIVRVGSRTAGGAPVANPPDPNAETDSEGEGIVITQGGLFYLINFLSRPEAEAVIAAHDRAPRLGSNAPDGWALLWDLGQRLGLGPDPTLARFFADRLGLDDPRGLAELDPPVAGTDLAALGGRLYGVEAVWNPRLLRVPARLRHTPSHLDLDMPLGAVRLEVRRVALDLDPGWVPWLGRVVSFHFLADPWNRTGAESRP